MVLLPPLVSLHESQVYVSNPFLLYNRNIYFFVQTTVMFPQWPPNVLIGFGDVGPTPSIAHLKRGGKICEHKYRLTETETDRERQTLGG
jgi:hypothetical protein